MTSATPTPRAASTTPPGQAPLGKNPPRRLLARPERREAILKAAAVAFAAKGFAATSMDDVAAEAGITKLIVYRHFGSKDALYEAVLERVSTRLAQEFVANVGRTPAPGTGARAMLTVAREDPAGFVLLWRHAAREPAFAEHAERIRRQVVQVAEANPGIATLPDARRRRWAASLVVSWIVDAVLHWLEEGPPDRDDELVALVAHALPAMVAAWAAVPPPRPS